MAITVVLVYLIYSRLLRTADPALRSHRGLFFSLMIWLAFVACMCGMFSYRLIEFEYRYGVEKEPAAASMLSRQVTERPIGAAVSMYREPRPVPLTLSLSSYASLQEVALQLGTKQTDLEVEEDSATPRSDQRPPYHRMVVIVRGVVDFNVTGSAQLIFFNDRLSSVRFYPQDPDAYKKRLQEKLALGRIEIAGSTLPGGTVVRVGTDYQGKFYVAFEDAVLENEHRQWIRDYAWQRRETLGLPAKRTAAAAPELHSTGRT